jgi:hypothetical protein
MGATKSPDSQLKIDFIIFAKMRVTSKLYQGLGKLQKLLTVDRGLWTKAHLLLSAN